MDMKEGPPRRIIDPEAMLDEAMKEENDLKNKLINIKSELNKLDTFR
jgi:hypothetical protein